MQLIFEYTTTGTEHDTTSNIILIHYNRKISHKTQIYATLYHLRGGSETTR